MGKMKENGVRNRQKNGKQNGKQNGVTKHEDEKKDEEFSIRQSPLTELIDSSLHIRAIYHIFVVILIMLLCDTVIYDLVERGKINIGLSVIAAGFGDIRRGLKLWVYDLCVVMAFYPLIMVYAAITKYTRKYTVLRPAVVLLGVAGVIAVEVAIAAVPVVELARKHLELGSSVAVTCEMFRFLMKIVAVSAACGPRCLNGHLPRPTFKHYVYFMFSPTLLYRDQYPRTNKIRWGVVAFHLSEVAAIIFYNCFLWERFIMPYWSDYGKERTVEAGYLVRGMFACVLPGVISFLCGFYCVLHAWLNAWSEMLKFGDRLFYEDWWTTSRFSLYYRRWNRVVHSWLRDHIYLPLAPLTGRPLATFTVFFVSSIAHEVILALSFGFFYPVLLVEFGVLGVIMVPLTATSGKRFPNAFNLIMWLSFFIGNGILWSLYPMEYFARRNCPPSENDSFFIPKSWTCPEVILKPNWTFQNPLRILSN
ncbi:sterol O-acyltransferase 2 [Helicoverpa zea]|uniref:sterol O-acyltransferase 2 n=1 Tax=Helicoverpa zea TaxID=7113 RepID=UPI001F571D4E|nr:sterol O-acyltransferase 2 [Helicoverpa zea]XP_047020980.1 sterol O-acyltransferase 2 [Helicoverpa zea]XP_047020981.1 sterol O-acyltransferase 2 [Helicoverpa zea]